MDEETVRTSAGRTLKIVHSPEPSPDSRRGALKAVTEQYITAATDEYRTPSSLIDNQDLFTHALNHYTEIVEEEMRTRFKDELRQTHENRQAINKAYTKIKVCMALIVIVGVLVVTNNLSMLF